MIGDEGNMMDSQLAWLVARDFLFVFKSNVAYLFIFRQFQSCSLPDWQQRKKQTKKQFYIIFHDTSLYTAPRRE